MANDILVRATFKISLPWSILIPCRSESPLSFPLTVTHEDLSSRPLLILSEIFGLRFISSKFSHENYPSYIPSSAAPQHARSYFGRFRDVDCGFEEPYLEQWRRQRLDLPEPMEDAVAWRRRKGLEALSSLKHLSLTDQSTLSIDPAELLAIEDGAEDTVSELSGFIKDVKQGFRVVWFHGEGGGEWWKGEGKGGEGTKEWGVGEGGKE